MKSLFLFIFWLYQRVEGNQPRQSNCLLHLSQFKLLLWTLGTCLPIRKLHMENEDLKGLHSCTTKIRTSWNIELLTKLFEIFYSVLCLWRDLPTLKSPIDDVNGDPKSRFPPSFLVSFARFPFANQHFMDWRNGAWSTCPKIQWWFECKDWILWNEVRLSQDVRTHFSTCCTIIVVPTPKKVTISQADILEL